MVTIAVRANARAAERELARLGRPARERALLPSPPPSEPCGRGAARIRGVAAGCGPLDMARPRPDVRKFKVQGSRASAGRESPSGDRPRSLIPRPKSRQSDAKCAPRERAGASSAGARMRACGWRRFVRSRSSARTTSARTKASRSRARCRTRVAPRSCRSSTPIWPKSAGGCSFRWGRPRPAPGLC